MSSVSQKTDANASKPFAARDVRNHLPGFRRIQENRIFIHISTPISVLQVSHRVKDPFAPNNPWKCITVTSTYRLTHQAPLRAEPIADLPPQTICHRLTNAIVMHRHLALGSLIPQFVSCRHWEGKCPNTSLTKMQKRLSSKMIFRDWVWPPRAIRACAPVQGRLTNAFFSG